jgi:hypothetical protein
MQVDMIGIIIVLLEKSVNLPSKFENFLFFYNKVLGHPSSGFFKLSEWLGLIEGAELGSYWVPSFMRIVKNC